MVDYSQRMSQQSATRKAHRLVFVLGDQLDPGATALREFEADQDVVLMVEAAEEAEHVASHRQRTTLFLSAMRHFALDLVERGLCVRYVRLDDPHNTQRLGSELRRAIELLSPDEVVVTRPGEHRVEADIRRVCSDCGVELKVLPDDTFTCSLEDFDAWAEGRKSLVMEYFYRERRRELGVLVDGKNPVGDQWNFDKQNRETFDAEPDVPRPYYARPDGVTEEVMVLVERRFPEAPGKMAHFPWPVTRAEARRALKNFVAQRLHGFGTYEDAMWTGKPVLYHSRLSAALNLKLLRPQECLEAVVEAYENGDAPLNDVEGFVRQIIGWREFIRGIYYREGPGYENGNALGHQGLLPEFYWSGETDMNCLGHCLTEVVEHAWGHHIPRLMVIGNFALMAGVHARKVHEWFLGMYVDAVEWVTAPNVIGMSQHADGGIVGTKPYAGSGKYIQRMSNYCDGCRFDPKKRNGEGACPFNVFYWDFLLAHQERFEKNHRMGMMMKNLERLDDGERRIIRQQADGIRRDVGIA